MHEQRGRVRAAEARGVQLVLFLCFRAVLETTLHEVRGDAVSLHGSGGRFRVVKVHDVGEVAGRL